ncbi:hypothetical protein [Rhizobium sp. L1K21]|uniref:hypothetical protein n=1 Tax=Rhizobium sp. L1K21 TaxID=2954933 RepID=UPI002093BF03|nr:hypothetical protein [Rhizobium sp. L1K21]MCO6185711.1 hypothetical protein [Rhizobium sp. L1K21]
MLAGRLIKWLAMSRRVIYELRLARLQRKALSDVYARGSVHLLRDVGLEATGFGHGIGYGCDVRPRRWLPFV